MLYGMMLCVMLDCIINATVNYVELMIPSDGDSLCVIVDASTVGVGGVLCVYTSNEWKPIVILLQAAVAQGISLLCNRN